LLPSWAEVRGKAKAVGGETTGRRAERSWRPEANRIQFLWPLTVVPVCFYLTYPLGPVPFGEDYGIPLTEQMAIAVLATIPVFLLFALLRRGLRRGFGLSKLQG
jgi:hypothetical protein